MAWTNIITGILSVLVSQRSLLGRTLVGSIALDTLEFVKDSLTLVNKGQLSEDELLEYWKSQGIEVQTARERYEKAKAEFLSEDE